MGISPWMSAPPPLPGPTRTAGQRPDYFFAPAGDCCLFFFAVEGSPGEWSLFDVEDRVVLSEAHELVDSLSEAPLALAALASFLFSLAQASFCRRRALSASDSLDPDLSFFLAFCCLFSGVGFGW